MSKTNTTPSTNSAKLTIKFDKEPTDEDIEAETKAILKQLGRSGASDDKCDDVIQPTRNRKGKALIIYDSKLRDPQGRVVVDLNLASFAMAGTIRNHVPNRKKKIVKVPKEGCLVFGNEGCPKIARHINPMKNYLYCQFIAPATKTSSNIGPTVENISWTLGQIEGISSYTSLYDEYCVRRIEVWMRPSLTEQTTANVAPGQYYTAYDMDGGTITVQSDIRQYDTCVISLFTESQYLCFTPSVAIATYGGAFTKYSFEKNQWLDVANTDINLYGMALSIDGSASANNFQWAFDTRIWVEFRGVR